MTLSEYILTYKGKTDSGEDGLVCNIPDYYDRYIRPLDKRFKDYSLKGSKLVICCFHDDTDPSLGLIRHRFLTDVKVYHCFGCGSSGTVIRMHQIIQEMYHNVRLTEEEACRDLSRLFNIPLDQFNVRAEDDYEGKYFDLLAKVSSLKGAYTSTDYARDLLNLRGIQNMSVDHKLHQLNIETIKMIATHKRLYE